jgi:hypothetical protein
LLERQLVALEELVDGVSHVRVTAIGDSLLRAMQRFH